MKRVLTLALCGFTAAVVAGPAFGQSLAYPHTRVLNDTRSDSVVHVRCEPPEGERIECSFSQVDVEPVPVRDIPGKEACGSLSVLGPALTDGVPPPGVDEEVFRERFARQPAEERADVAAFVSAFSDYCADVPGSADRLAEVMGDRTRRTCTLTISTYTLFFDWNAADNRWETLSEPASDDCGTVTVAAFEQPAGGAANAPWNYRITQRTTTAANGATCPAGPETQHLYAAEPADIHAGCDYLRFRD